MGDRERAPSRPTGRSTLLLPFPVAAVHLILWDIGGALWPSRAGQPRIHHHNFVLSDYLRRFNCTNCSQFALRRSPPALEAGRPPRRFCTGHHGRNDDGVSLGFGRACDRHRRQRSTSIGAQSAETQLASAVIPVDNHVDLRVSRDVIVLAWLTAAPVQWCALRSSVSSGGICERIW